MEEGAEAGCHDEGRHVGEPDHSRLAPVQGEEEEQLQSPWAGRQGGGGGAGADLNDCREVGGERPKTSMYQLEDRLHICFLLSPGHGPVSDLSSLPRGAIYVLFLCRECDLCSLVQNCVRLVRSKRSDLEGKGAFAR